MRDYIVSILIAIIIPKVAWADCNWATGITPGPNHTFVYSDECHLEVGHLVEQNKTYQIEIGDLNKAIELKDLALQQSDKNAQTWNAAAENLEQRLQKVDSIEKSNQWLYFGLGVASTFLAGWMASKLIHN